MAELSSELPTGHRLSAMRKELFGVFGDPGEFRGLRATDEFDAVLSGKSVTLGVRDPSLGIPGRTTYHETDEGRCVVWGEAFPPAGADSSLTDAARWLYSAFRARGLEAFDGLNGSYVAVVERDGEAVVATDPIRSWDCFYVDAGPVRAFGTDPAAIGRLLDECRLSRRALLEFLHLSIVLGERTLFERVRRVPFDGYLTADGVGEFDRFTYEPRSFDYVEELARRLRDALARRAAYPGRSGLLLSAGLDARSFLAGPTDVDHCYTIGSPDSQEGRTARLLADQYGVGHTVLAPDVRYLAADEPKVGYTGGLRESLHAHHAGYDDRFEMDTVYHGLLYDTLLKGYFLEPARRRVFGTDLRLRRLDTDVDPAEALLSRLGFQAAESRRLPAAAGEWFPDVDVELDDPEAFCREGIEAELDRQGDRADSPGNLIDCFVLGTQPAGAFRAHLADNYREAYVAADAALLEWHRRTPPRHRHSGTMHAALRLLSEDVLRHPPPDHRTGSAVLNQIDRFARRTLPVLEGPEPSWPDRERLYEEHDLDEYFFPDRAPPADLSARWKLRIHDARWWRSAVETRGVGHGR